MTERPRFFNGLRIALGGSILLWIVILASIMAFAQEPVTDRDGLSSHCAGREEIYLDGKLVYACEVSGDTVTETDARGTVTTRPASTIEIDISSRTTSEKNCLETVKQARTLLQTPASKGDLSELSIRLAAVETVLLSECNG